ncbi:sensor histidine kinase [Streptomyces sp. RFCAC02]|uniref:sensor histidine kinase n=1 Tax=Streptomyces sp. RFCAC02 TaxID=2499143 RepID=UPI00101EE154|nr:sensor histidine kinase [Streptomyces sp. RFCAC02]
MRTGVVNWLRTALGLLSGAVLAVLGLSLVLVGSPVLAAGPPPARRAVIRAAGRLAGRPGGEGIATVRYLLLRVPLGLLGGLVVASVMVGAIYASMLVWAVWPFGWDVLPAGFGGVLLLFLGVHGVSAVGRLENELALRVFGPGERAALVRRIDELAASRAGVVAAVHDERRRIERDLHDGVQQRMVALGMLLGRARRAGEAGDDARSRELLRQAQDEAGATLAELREVAWRVYPAVLDEAGLPAALEAVAERCPLPVRLEYDLLPEPDREVAAVIYFVVSEAVTNTVKHAGADGVAVRVAPRDGGVTVEVRDDGRGGADPAGSGLLGLARRAAALDGTLRVDSPPGGPTTLTMELPCV